MRYLLPLVCCVLLSISACSPKIPVSELTIPVVNVNEPFSMKLSIHAGKTMNDVMESHRVTGVMWGNGDLPIRLDVSAGIGAVLARCVENDEDLAVYIPNEDLLLVRQKNKSKDLSVFGVKMPFYLRELSLLARGDFTPIVNGTVPCTVSKKTENGLPLSFTTDTGWTVQFDYRDTARPHKITAHSKDGYEAVIFIKQIQTVAPYSPEQLFLDVPDDVSMQ